MVVRPSEILAKYSVTVGPAEKLLGVNVVALSLQRRRDGVTVERMWVDPSSGVVYRRELYSGSGKRIGMSTIIDMHWGTKAQTERFDPSLQVPTQAQEGSANGVPERLANSYRLLGSYRLKIAHRATEQWLYSDGIHALSVFRTPGGLRAPSGFSPAVVGHTRAWRGPGPGTWAWQGGGATWVLVAEEAALDPSDLLKPFPKGGPSVWARMGSVWSRTFRGVRDLF